MESSEILHADWCRNLFNFLKEGGVWGVPRSGLIFQKRDGKLRLTSPPAETFVKRMVQAADFEAIRRHFAEAGIEVTKE
jgi:hypothetical protein